MHAVASTPPIAVSSVFMQARFWALMLCSLVLPAAIFLVFFVRRAFSRRAVLGYGLLLIALAAVDLVLLRMLASEVQNTASLADDLLFSSELSIALYLVPTAFGTLGINMVSHVLMHYLGTKEARFEARQRAEHHPGLKAATGPAGSRGAGTAVPPRRRRRMRRAGALSAARPSSRRSSTRSRRPSPSPWTTGPSD